MKFKFLPRSTGNTWQNNKAFVWFLLSLLLIHFILKIIFYQYNQPLLFTGNEAGISGPEKFTLLKWSLLQDMLTLLGINAVLLFSLTASRLISPKLAAWFIIPVFVLVNSFAVMLNGVDIFYYRFHFQRANADLLYVTDHPVSRLMQQHFFMILLFITSIAGIIMLVWLLHKKLCAAFFKGHHAQLSTAILFILFATAFIFRNRFSKILLPNYPLIEIQSKRLPFIQNSFHTLLYSVFRKGESAQFKNYMTDAECDSIMPIRKKISMNMGDSNKKNIVLFIMESVPYDFFDTESPFKVTMPFFDSLLEKSIFYKNAFCYAHQSNKGITAILAGIPTVADIPVYHSQYINMPFTPIGNALKKSGYGSFFSIGDEYDNFGFAKCINWLGIDRYFSKEDIPGYKKLPAHTMGIQDEYVLGFFRKKILEQQEPFFAVNYNISTHYPYDVPELFANALPAGYNKAMKAMRYYDYSLQQFFNAAQKEAWFSNTMFIFCSDHWLFPQGKMGAHTSLSSFQIPIIIYDPSINTKKIINEPVSQFDILGTILATTAYQDSIITYGDNLLNPLPENRVVFTRANANLYQAIDSSWILGFSISNARVEYLYNYKKDKYLQKNLVHEPAAGKQLTNLTTAIKAFLQKVNMQKNGRYFK